MSLFQPSKPLLTYDSDGRPRTIVAAEITQYDRSTVARSKEFSSRYESSRSMAILGFESGRYSPKISLRIAQKALVKAPCHCDSLLDDNCYRCEAIKKMKVNGDWALVEEKKT